MITYDEYFKGLLNQILDSHQNLTTLQDKPDDLDTINKEILKIMAVFQAVTNRVRGSKNPRTSHKDLATMAETYINTYSFEHEIRMISTLYSGDINRIRNIRYKILESFEDMKLVDKLKYIAEDL